MTDLILALNSLTWPGACAFFALTLMISSIVIAFIKRTL